MDEDNQNLEMCNVCGEKHPLSMVKSHEKAAKKAENKYNIAI